MNNYPQQFKEGKSKEADFIKVAQQNNFHVSHATPQQDMKQHWDIRLMKSYKVDVKGLKKIRRTDPDVQEDFHYVELMNVQGLVGWAFAETVEVFAFETFNYWILVKKENLQDLIREKVKKEWVNFPTLYKMYRRSGRKDAITLVKSLDLMYIAFHKFKK